MTEPIAIALVLLSLGGAVLAGWHTWRREPFSNPLFYVLSALEVALLAALVGGCVALAQTSRDVDGVLFVSYLVTVVVIPPAALIWGISEKSRWGTGVVVVALVTVAALVLRVHGIWEGNVV
ncbi:hypothetical protein [Aeromicrobium sp. CTD01-1L150]|uniref:hypothetical protein n=1 Tax=Aeromicrobium sp. CTD01-1L150 TaxID=3341830 RepID=UPI0035C1E9C8